MPSSVVKRTDFIVLNADTSESIDVGLLDIYIVLFKLYFMPNYCTCIDTFSLGWGGEDMITRHYTASGPTENMGIQNKITGFQQILTQE